eukprot:CAMPEP_0170524978 /NCGR_PEP_ID=MMETSP0209-20121228/10443_1 /TAXON_ID=665100 ORGANISM="Litonotus pictus, Strain P1" /NCGR_SAMPLE_ID=MMETSP0209 /ASSEMBLY_ACC=CAM_ASM_000301 /LENGTH=429 /DNA_ID=CAMNT_0010813991 /DNA_START=149 /DNA_END=1435 /DNA_ORIENTATION=+
MSLDYLSLMDYFYIFYNGRNNVTIGGVIYLSDFDHDTVKAQVKLKLFDQLPKLSAKLIAFMGDYFWDTPQVVQRTKVERDEIAETRITSAQVKDNQELKKYLEEQVNLPMCQFERPIEFHIIEIQEASDDLKHGCLYIKLDHSFSDGLGMCGMLGFLDNDFDISKYPDFMRKKMGVSYYIKAVWDFFLAMTYGWVWNFKKDSKYKNNTNKYKPLYHDLPNNSKRYSRQSKISDIYSFNMHSIKAFCKKNKVSVNDLLVYSVLKALKGISPATKEILTCIPVGFTNLPHKIGDVDLCNKAYGILDYVLLPDSEVDSHEDKATKYKLLDIPSSMFKVRNLQMLTVIMTVLIPFPVLKNLQSQIGPEVTITNVPGPMKEMKIGKCRMTRMCPISNSSFFGIFVSICSYMNQVNVYTSIDRDVVDIDPDRFSR